LGLFAAGAFLFYPAARTGTFIPFLGSLFIIACGLSCLETAANPYTTVLGPPEGAARRINFAQSFNGLGWILGPLIGGLVIFGAEQKTGAQKFDSLTQPYLYIGCIVLAVAVVFMFSKLPDVSAENSEHIGEKAPLSELKKHKGFVLAVVAQFLYVAAQTGVNSFFINYVTETMNGVQETVAAILSHFGYIGSVLNPRNPEQAASVILAIGGMGCFWIGRLFGSWLLKFARPGKLLMSYGAINTFLMILVVLEIGWPSVIALFSSYFFMSVMFPTIFALGLKGLGPLTKGAASFLVMAVAGGAFCPPLMGLIADHAGMPVAFIIPLVCFAFVSYYGLTASKAVRTA
jgi:FHS family L-fucose permease-like MFS transporter